MILVFVSVLLVTHGAGSPPLDRLLLCDEAVRSADKEVRYQP